MVQNMELIIPCFVPSIYHLFGKSRLLLVKVGHRLPNASRFYLLRKQLKEKLFFLLPAPLLAKAEGLGVGLRIKEILFNNPTPNLSALRRGEEL